MRSESSKQKELDSLISVLRAIVLSRKQPCPLLSVMNDYYELEGRILPYHVFGFKTAKDFFMQSGEFHISQMFGESYVATKSNKKSAHIASLVRQQKSTGRTPHLTKSVNPPSQTVRPKNLVRGRSRNLKNQTSNPPIQIIQQQQHQLFLQQKEEVKSQLQQQLKKELQDGLRKQERQLQVKFEKEKEFLKKEFLAELQAKTKESKTKNDANNNCADSVKSFQQNARMSLQKSSTNVKQNFKSNIDLVAIELDEHKVISSELTLLRERLTQLSFDTENSGLFDNMIKTTDKKQIKGQSQIQPKSVAPITNLKKPQAQQATPFGNNKQNYAGNISSLPPTDLRHRLNAMRSQKEEEKTDETHCENQSLRPILGQYNNVGNQQLNPLVLNNNNKATKCSQQKLQPPKQTQQQPLKQLQTAESTNMIQQDLYQQSQQKHPRHFPKFPSVQNRLKFNINCDKNANGNTLSPSATVAQETSSLVSKIETTKQPVQKPSSLTVATNRKVWKFDSKLDPCTSIALYCAARKYGEPKYTVFKSKQGLYDCQLVINSNTIYSTYPQDYNTEFKARLACAEKAIQQIQVVEARDLLPTFPDDKEFLNVLHNELLLHPNGIISDKMSEWFVDKFGYSLPDHWFMLIKTSSRFLIEDGIRESTFIILANRGAINDDANDLTLKTLPVQMEPLKLPWSEKVWELYITHCVSTTEIWAYLLGAEYNTRFDALMTDLNNQMSKEKIRPDVIAPKHIYLVEGASSWHRVRVESLDKEKQKAFCFYIDFGDTQYLPVNELYLCDVKYLWLPPQAVPFSLFGLDDLASNPNAFKYLKERLLEKVVIGEVVTKKAEFEANDVIQMIMFDTSTEDDINLNLLLQEEICKHAQPPQLRSEGSTSVNITNIDNDNGEISLQIINADSEYVHKTLKQIVESKLNREQHNCSVKELLRHQLLLVHDDDHSMKWCRAKLIDLSQSQNLVNSQDKMIDVLYVDYNIKRRVHISKIYLLESLSMALSKFPSQAVRVKLHNIPEFSQNIVGRMRALLPENCQAFVRVEIPGDVPHVTILRRVNGPDMPFCNINDDLRLEIERAKDATLCLNDSSNGSASSTPEVLKSPNQLFRSFTLSSASMMPLKISELPKLREYNINLPLNSTFYVNVILVSNPLSFMVQPYNGDFERLLKMMEQLQDYSINNDAFIPADMVEIGQAYAVKKEENYYRVIAKVRYGDMINVSFCDYGDSGTVRSDHLKVLPAKFRQLPIMGINARIYGIKGKTDDVWTKDDVKRFRDLVLGKHMASFIKGTRRDEKGTIELSLDLVDVQGEDDVNIRQVLLNEKRALPIESSNN